jgi:calcineurin-like phosphoesterase family protein
MSKNIWFSSDFHWRHRAILKYDKRPFTDIDVHDEAILEGLISTLKAGDDFYFLGDLAWFKTKEDLKMVTSWLFKLRAFCKVNLFFIKGNHDHKDTIRLYEELGTFLGEQKRIRIGATDIVLNHFPMRTWNKSHHGSFHLYGHHHGDIEHTPYGRSMDVAINIHSYKPINWEDVDMILSAREPYILEGDHHTPKTQ